MSKFRDPQWKTDFLKTQLKKELSRKEPSTLALDYYTGKITYADYLKSDHWRSIRQQKIDKCNGGCEVCGEDEVRLDVHHKNYENLGHETLEDLAALCPYCHTDVHKIISDLKSKEFKQKLTAIAVEYFVPNLVRNSSKRIPRSVLNAKSVPTRITKSKKKKPRKRRQIKK